MSAVTPKLEPAFDFAASKANILLRQGQTEVSIDGRTFLGEGKPYLDLLPRTGIYLYEEFQNVSAAAMSKVLENKNVTFRMGGCQVEGFCVNIHPVSYLSAPNFTIIAPLSPRVDGNNYEQRGHEYDRVFLFA